jgi:hypothetical protein
MGWLALVIAAIGGVCVALPGPGMFVAMGLGLFAIAAGAVGYRRLAAPGPARLAGAAAITVGSIALVLSAARYALTLAAVRKLESLFS